MITGLVWVFDIAPVKKEHLYLDIGVGLLLGALAGSRMVYVIFQWDYFRNHLIEIPQFQLGGYSWVGAIPGWIAAIVIASRMIHHSMLELSDAFLPLGGCLVIGVWLGCWFDGIAYGFLIDQWWALPAVDEWGVIANRFPVQLIGAISTLILMMGIDRIKTHPVWKHGLGAPGKSTVLFLSVVSVTQLLLTLFRQDPAPIWMGYRLDFWISLGIFILSMILFSAIDIRQKLTARKNSFVASGL